MPHCREHVVHYSPNVANVRWRRPLLGLSLIVALSLLAGGCGSSPTHGSGSDVSKYQAEIQSAFRNGTFPSAVKASDAVLKCGAASQKISTGSVIACTVNSKFGFGVLEVRVTDANLAHWKELSIGSFNECKGLTEAEKAAFAAINQPCH